ncbi:MAG: type II toxin-antitoxin system VapC family toxin [Proteobacteria bacterium]|nr:type II toxin-antitoxin system VapC family toxin [Pseudomonadota bacterium]
MEFHRYLLDTNIISHVIRNPQGPVFDHLETILPATACTSIMASAEIHFGLKKKASEKLIKQAELILSVIDVLPLESPADEHYGDIRAHLNRMGQPIGWNDLIIAAHARSLNLILVTDNVREFSRIPGLAVENWL